MNVTVELSGQLKQAIGASELTIELDSGSTTNELIARLQQEHAEVMKKFALDSDENLLPSLLFVVNDKQVRANSPVELKDGDRTAILSPISGG